MVRFPGRSRGCAVCRKRRIKCDEKLPECTQCKRNKKKCPGPVVDTFFVICSEDRERQIEFNSAALKTPNVGVNAIWLHGYSPDPEIINPVADRHASSPKDDLRDFQFCRNHGYEVEPDSSKDLEIVEAPRIALNGFHLPSWYQPSRGELFDELFFSHFFSTFGRGVESIRACSWLKHIPNLIATKFRSKAMKYSTRATCMAFYGALNGEISIQSEARKTYVRALMSQRRELYGGRQISQANTSKIPSQEAICTSIMMAYFEMIVKSTTHAWKQHFGAAASMLEMRGPERCRDAFTHQLFRTVRLGAVYVSITNGIEHTFARQNWVKVTPEHLKTPLDAVIDILFSLSTYTALLKSDQYSSIGSEQSSTARFLRARLSSLRSELDSIFEGDKVAAFPEALDDPLPGCLRAMRNGASLIIARLLQSTSNISYFDKYTSQALTVSAAILDEVDFIDLCTQSHASKIFVTTVLPLEIVAAWSPCLGQKLQACKRLEQL